MTEEDTDRRARAGVRALLQFIAVALTAYLVIVQGSRIGMVSVFTMVPAVGVAAVLVAAVALTVVVALCLRFLTVTAGWGVALLVGALVAVLTGVFWICEAVAGRDTLRIAIAPGLAPLVPAGLAGAASLLGVRGPWWRLTGVVAVAGLLVAPGVPIATALADGVTHETELQQRKDSDTAALLASGVIPFLPPKADYRKVRIGTTESQTSSHDGSGTWIIRTQPAVGSDEATAACHPSLRAESIQSCEQHGDVWVVRTLSGETSVVDVREGRRVEVIAPIDAADAERRGEDVLATLREATPEQVEASVRWRVELDLPADERR